VRNGGASGVGYQAEYPYGVEYATTANDREKYATYTRDSLTGLDYSVNRYYSSLWGRFVSPDPYNGSAKLGTPQTWDRYVYAANDPANITDSRGLDPYCGPNMSWDGEGCTFATGGSFSGGPPPGASAGGSVSWNGTGGCDFFDPTVCDGDPGDSCTGAPTGSSFAPVPFGPANGSCLDDGGDGGPTAVQPQISLNEADDCIYPKGTSTNPGTWTLEVEYQVLVNGANVSGTNSRIGYSVSKIVESVTNATFNVTAGGVWCLSSATCAQPGSLNAHGQFWDALGGNGTANQGFLLNGQTIPVVTYANSSVFKNSYNSSSQSISVGNGALVGNSQTRKCGRNGDPTVD
jgi:RHS repeat-associated protein